MEFGEQDDVAACMMRIASDKLVHGECDTLMLSRAEWALYRLIANCPAVNQAAR